MKIALAGNPNCGKTTMFNAFTGKTEKVGNWSGVTVEKKIAKLKKKYNTSDEEVYVVDLPGTYGIKTYTNDEMEAVQFIKNNEINCLINIVDALNLERSLNFTLELKELGIPMIVALNKFDRVEKKNQINLELLEDLIGCPVVPTSAYKSKGLKKLAKVALQEG
ncbi:FeoB small GTPase domain-containing protein [Mycoplasmatota bacterium WC44]